MGVEIKKNEKYSHALLSEGSKTPADDDREIDLPEWFDEKQMKIAQKFILFTLNSQIRTLYIALTVAAAVPSLLQLLLFTKQSSTAMLAYRRYRANDLHVQEWYRHSIKPGSRAWKSLETVRKMHVVVNRRSTKAGVGIISQKDMAITLFTFMGFHVLEPHKFGIVGTRKQFEAFCHFWRVIGYMLGTKDEFNCCGDSLDETLSRLRAIQEDILLPALTFPCEDYESYTRIAVEGMWHSEPTLHYDSAMFIMKRAMKMPGYHYFASEAPGDTNNQSVLKQLSYYTRFRILLDIIVYEHLSQILIFRWIFNITRFIFVQILNFYPFLALWSFGKKYAYVQILKSKK